MRQSDHTDLRAVLEEFENTMREGAELPYTHPAWYLLFWRRHLHRPGAEWFFGTTEDELAEFVLYETRVDKHTFETLSNKKFRHLLGESLNEMRIVRTLPGFLSKLSAKVHTSIYAKADGLWLRETGRHVIENDRDIVHEMPKPYASSGTIHRFSGTSSQVEELPADAVRRELKEEISFEELGDWELTALNPAAPVVLPPRPSTMYGCPGVRFESIEAEWRFQLTVPSVADFHARCPGLRTLGNKYGYRDGDLDILVNWFSEAPKWRG